MAMRAVSFWMRRAGLDEASLRAAWSARKGNGSPGRREEQASELPPAHGSVAPSGSGMGKTAEPVVRQARPLVRRFGLNGPEFVSSDGCRQPRTTGFPSPGLHPSVGMEDHASTPFDAPIRSLRN